MTSKPTAGPVEATRSPAATLKTLAGGAVTFEGGLWARRQAVNRAAALPHGLRMLETAGNLDNLRIAAGRATGRFRGRVFMDSDVYKWLEAAAFEMARVPSAELSKSCDTLIELVAAAQGDDGYLNSYYTVAEPGRRWTDLTHGHELYCLGHMIQAALAFRRGTGDGRLLAIATRFVDYVHSVFGPGRRETTDGHAEIEMALVELYRETGERRHLDLAVFFLDQRGRGRIGPNRHDSLAAFPGPRAGARGDRRSRATPCARCTSRPERADVYLETGDAALLQTLTRQWDDMVEGKLYLTGGVGARHLAESFGHPYELPSDLAYSETCGAIASLMWSWRMLLATGQARYADLIERTLYNAILAGVSLERRAVLLREPAGQQRRGRSTCTAAAAAAQAVAPRGVLPAQRDAPAGLARALRRHARRLGPADPPVRRRPPADRRDRAHHRDRVSLGGSGAAHGRARRARRRGRWRCACPAGARAPACASTAARRRTRWRRGYLRLDRTWARGDVVELDLPMRGALRRSPPVDRVHARVRGRRAGPARLLPRAGRPRGLDVWPTSRSTPARR